MRRGRGPRAVPMTVRRTPHGPAPSLREHRPGPARTAVPEEWCDDGHDTRRTDRRAVPRGERRASDDRRRRRVRDRGVRPAGHALRGARPGRGRGPAADARGAAAAARLSAVGRCRDGAAGPVRARRRGGGCRGPARVVHRALGGRRPGRGGVGGVPERPVRLSAGGDPGEHPQEGRADGGDRRAARRGRGRSLAGVARRPPRARGRARRPGAGVHGVRPAPFRRSHLTGHLRGPRALFPPARD